MEIVKILKKIKKRKMKIHELKTNVEFFTAIYSGNKQFEIRKDDRDFEVGDELVLKEYSRENLQYTGRFLHRKVDYVLRGGQFGLEDGYVIMSISKI
jgi:murein L,D-transpeptidase YafK